MPRVFLSVVLTSLFAWMPLAIAQINSGLPKTQTLAPPLHLEKMLGNPGGESVDLSGLRGKVVVIEFWATWCAPCVGEIPAINALVKSLDPKQVVFISVTDEDPEKIKRFLAKRPISGWIGIDTSSAIFNRYGVSSRPATIVIDTRGKVASNNLRPDQLSRRQLLALAQNQPQKLVAGGSSTMRAKVAAAQKAAEEEELGGPKAQAPREALFSLTITPGDGGMGRVMVGDASLDILNQPVDRLVELGMGINEKRMISDPSLGERKYNLHLNSPGVHPEQCAEALELAISSAANVRFEHIRTPEDVLLLQRSASEISAPQSPQSGSHLAHYNVQNARFIAMSANADQLAAAAWDALSVPVLNDAGVGYGCSGNLTLKPGDREALRLWLEQSCGFTLVPGNRVVDRLKLSPVVAPRNNVSVTQPGAIRNP